MKTTSLTLYVDGKCPLCRAEVKRLRAWDLYQMLTFIDIAQRGFDPAPLGVELAALNRQLHGWTAQGQCVVGIDSMIAAYTLVGRGWMVAPLRLPGMRSACQALYRAFARNRMAVSRWMGLQISPACSDEACAFKLDTPLRQARGSRAKRPVDGPI
jgi:predicted DCC family thiol-disulfide oxidoreductase YuxK